MKHFTPAVKNAASVFGITTPKTEVAIKQTLFTAGVEHTE